MMQKKLRPRHLAFSAILLFVFVIPVILLILMSFATRWKYPDLLPQEYSTRAYRYIFLESPGFFRALGSSVFYAFTSGILAAILSLLPARLLSRHTFPGKEVLEAILLTPILLPVMTFSMGIHIIMLHLGLTGHWVGVVLVLTLFNYPYMLRALISGYQQVPVEMSVSAENLGASLGYSLLRVEIPMLIPSFVAGYFMVFLGAFSEYFLVFLIGGGAVPSMTGYLYPFIKSSDYPVSSLLVMIFLIVPILLFVLQDIAVHMLYSKRRFT